MSYDLFFIAPSDESIATTALREYFGARPNFKVQDQQAWYENKDSGVYFSFGLTQPSPVAKGEQALASVASFNLNYFRPHVFGLEAEPEVSAFIQAFNLGIHDPQFGGMGDGPYSREGFLSGWNKGNEFGYKAIIEKNGRSSVQYSLPGETIERYWRWNYGRAALQASFGESAFVPSIMFFVYEQRLVSAAVWGDAIPIALPPVDLFVIVRKDLAQRRLFLTKRDTAVATAGEVEPLVAQYPLHAGPMPFRLLSYSKPPSDLVDWVRGLPGGKPDLQGVAVDAILNAEIVDRFAAA